MSRVVHIGNATLYHGDCLAIMPSLGTVDHIICDPPYEQRLHDLKAVAAKPLRRDGGPELQSLNFSGIDNIRHEFVALVEQQCAAWFVVFCTPEGVARWADVINESAIKYKRACAWVKPDSTPQLNGQGPAQGFENFIVAWNGCGHSKWNAGGKRGVYTHLTNPKERDGRHPTEKPRRLMAEIINDFTQPFDTILDPFMGSGTTGIACHELGRRFIGIEKDERYFDIACERIEKAQRQADMFVGAAA